MRPGPRQRPPNPGDREAAQQACEGAGKTWDGSASQAECSGATTDLGFAASVRLNFCKGRTCGITIQHKPESAWSSAFVELKQALVAKYGEPTESKSVVPGWCGSETQFVACLQEGSLRLHITLGTSLPAGPLVL